MEYAQSGATCLSPIRSDSYWRNRAEFIQGRTAIVEFLTRKWVKELDYRPIKELWAWEENRIAVRFAYEWHDDPTLGFASYGNENWEFDQERLDARRHACINDLPIQRNQTASIAGIGPASRPGRPSRLDRTWFVSAR